MLQGDHPFSGFCLPGVAGLRGAEGNPLRPHFYHPDGESHLPQQRHGGHPPEEKGSPRCLRKLYQVTREGLERHVALLVEQAQDRLLEEENLSTGWEE